MPSRTVLCGCLIVITGLTLYPARIAFAEAVPPAQTTAELERQVKESVSKGLRWLAARQNEGGQFVDAKATVKEDVALTALSGLSSEDPDVRRGIDFLARSLGPAAAGHYFYGRYYACQWLSSDPSAARQHRAALAHEILDAQQRGGSWKGDVGEVYATASALVVLQWPQKQLWIFGAH